jgi:hypothetical protein
LSASLPEPPAWFALRTCWHGVIGTVMTAARRRATCWRCVFASPGAALLRMTPAVFSSAPFRELTCLAAPRV